MHDLDRLRQILGASQEGGNAVYKNILSHDGSRVFRLKDKPLQLFLSMTLTNSYVHFFDGVTYNMRFTTESPVKHAREVSIISNILEVFTDEDKTVHYKGVKALNERYALEVNTGEVVEFVPTASGYNFIVNNPIEGTNLEYELERVFYDYSAVQMRLYAKGGTEFKISKLLVLDDNIGISAIDFVSAEVNFRKIKFVVNIRDYSKLPCELFMIKKPSGKLKPRYDQQEFRNTRAFIDSINTIQSVEQDGEEFYTYQCLFTKDNHDAMLNTIRHMIEDFLLIQCTLLSNQAEDFGVELNIGYPVIMYDFFRKAENSAIDIDKLYPIQLDRAGVWAKNRINFRSAADLYDEGINQLTESKLRELFILLIKSNKQLAYRINFQKVLNIILDPKHINHRGLVIAFLKYYYLVKDDILNNESDDKERLIMEVNLNE